MRLGLTGSAAVVAMSFCGSAAAQQPGAPPDPPQVSYTCPPGQVLVYPPGQPPQCQFTQPQQPYPPQQYPPPPAEVRPAPPPVVYVEPEEPTHTPRFALWTGASVAVLGYGGGFFKNEHNDVETTGALAGTGPTVTLNLGARLARRYIPYVFWEHGILKQGRRFEGTDAHSTSDYYGVGFRYIAFDVDTVGFVSDLSVGFRSVTITSNDRGFYERYSMRAFEYFHLGLGAEVRLSTLFALTPMVTFSGGTMSEADGTIRYSGKGSADGAGGAEGSGITKPLYQNAQIQNQASYVVVGIGIGGNVDLFGK